MGKHNPMLHRSVGFVVTKHTQWFPWQHSFVINGLSSLHWFPTFLVGVKAIARFLREYGHSIVSELRLTSPAVANMFEALHVTALAVWRYERIAQATDWECLNGCINSKQLMSSNSNVKRVNHIQFLLDLIKLSLARVAWMKLDTFQISD